MALSEEQKQEIMAKRAMEFFNNSDNFEQDLSNEILNTIETQLPHTHPTTIAQLHMAIVQLVVDNTDYTG